MSDTTKHWAGQVTTLRVELTAAARKLAGVETALLAQKVDHEKAVVRARQESIHAVSDEIKRLSDVLGGVNALYNTHVGAVRQEVERLGAGVAELIQRIDLRTVVAASETTMTKALVSPSSNSDLSAPLKY